MNQMDSVKMGLLCILIIAVAISVTALITKTEKAYEICIAALAGVTVIGGWLGHAQPPTQDTKQDAGAVAAVEDLHKQIDGTKP